MSYALLFVKWIRRSAPINRTVLCAASLRHSEIDPIAPLIRFLSVRIFRERGKAARSKKIELTLAIENGDK